MPNVLWIALVCTLLSFTSVHASSLDLLHHAAARSQVSPALLLAIAWVESRGVLTALNVEGDSLYPKDFEEGYAVLARHVDQNVDVGVMQVNVPTWSPRLQLSPEELYHPRTNLPVAAAVLRQCIDRHKGDLWKGVGCYHSPRLRRQRRYVQNVWAAYNLLRRRGVFGPALVQREEPVVQVAYNGNRGSAPPISPRPSKKRTVQEAVSEQLPVQEAVPVQTTEIAALPEAPLPTCPGNRPQVHTRQGPERMSLAFFTPQYGLPVVDPTSTAPTRGLCVGCTAADLRFFHTYLAVPIQHASPQQLQELEVTCLPTVVQMVSS